MKEEPTMASQQKEIEVLKGQHTSMWRRLRILENEMNHRVDHPGDPNKV